MILVWSRKAIAESSRTRRSCRETEEPVNNYTIAYACRNIFNTIKTNGQSSLEKYTSHFIERVVCERELETKQRLQLIDPHSYGYHSLSFPFSRAIEPGAWGPSLCWDMVLIPASSFQLTWTSCHRGYMIIWHPPTSWERHNFALNSTPRQSRSPLISWYTGCTCYLHRYISFGSLAELEVNMQQYCLLLTSSTCCYL